MNKRGARNSLARAVFIHQLGEIRDRTYENQQHRASGLNLLVAAITRWNTRYLAHAVVALRETEAVPDRLLARSKLSATAAQQGLRHRLVACQAAERSDAYRQRSFDPSCRGRSRNAVIRYGYPEHRAAGRSRRPARVRGDCFPAPESTRTFLTALGRWPE